MSPCRAVLIGALALAACTDLGPMRGAGTLTATLRSPNGSEGAAVLLLEGGGVLGVTAVGDTEAFALTSGEKTRVVLINQAGGLLAFSVAVSEVSQPLVAFVGEVAGPDDRLRSDLSEYRVEFRR